MKKLIFAILVSLSFSVLANQEINADTPTLTGDLQYFLVCRNATVKAQ